MVHLPAAALDWARCRGESAAGLPYEAGSASILPASAGTGRRGSKAVSPDRCLSDACRLEGGAPGYGLLRHPLRL